MTEMCNVMLYSSDDRCRWNNFREKPKPVTFDSGYNTMDSVVDKTRWSEVRFHNFFSGAHLHELFLNFQILVY